MERFGPVKGFRGSILITRPEQTRMDQLCYDNLCQYYLVRLNGFTASSSLQGLRYSLLRMEFSFILLSPTYYCTSSTTRLSIFSLYHHCTSDSHKFQSPFSCSKFEKLVPVSILCPGWEWVAVKHDFYVKFNNNTLEL